MRKNQCNQKAYIKREEQKLDETINQTIKKIQALNISNYLKYT